MLMMPAFARVLVLLRAAWERMLWYEGSHSSARRYRSISSRQDLWKRRSSPSFSAKLKSLSKSWPRGGREAIASDNPSMSMAR